MNKNKLISGIFVAVFFAVIVSSCNMYKPVKVGTIAGIKMNEFSGKELSFKVLIPIENPNSYDLKIVKYDFDVSMNDINLGKVQNEETIIIPANSNEIQELPAKVKLTNLFSGAVALFSVFSNDKIKVKAKGTMEVKAFMISKTVDIDEESEVDLLQIQKNIK